MPKAETVLDGQQEILLELSHPTNLAAGVLDVAFFSIWVVFLPFSD